MPTDAKLGLVVGVGVVLAAAVVFFRKPAETPEAAPGPAAVVTSTPPVTAARPVSRSADAGEAPPPR